MVESFRFLPAEKIAFEPGQFLQLILDEKNTENKELNKYLSISSSPLREYIEMTKRLSESGFSRRLGSLKAGDTVLFKAPLGNCVFKEEYKKLGFLIGGIGITPVISIIEYVVEKKLDNDILLLYSNRTDDDIAFKKELDYWQQAAKNIKVFYIVTDCEPKDKTCIQAVIDEDLMLEKMYELNRRIFFISGPPKMVEEMDRLCLNLGCSKESIKKESFIGY